MPDWALGLVLSLRWIVALCTVLTLLQIGYLTAKTLDKDWGQYLLGAIGASAGVTFLALVPFTWPG